MDSTLRTLLLLLAIKAYITILISDLFLTLWTATMGSIFEYRDGTWLYVRA